MPQDNVSTRSLRVSSQSKAKVRSALKRSSFPSQKALAVEINMARATVNKFFTGRPIDFLNFVELCQQLNLDWQEVAALDDNDATEANRKEEQIDLKDAPIPKGISARPRESEQLTRYIQDESCRVIAVTGLLKIGKTRLVAQVAHSLSSEFDFIFWRSLKSQQKPEAWLEDALRFFTKDNKLNVEDFSKGLEQLIAFLAEKRCLLVFQDFEFVMQAGEGFGNFSSGYEKYEEILSKADHKKHQSCLVLISRELPKYISVYQDSASPMRLIQLGGLTLEAAREILEGEDISDQRKITGSQDAKDELIRRYDHHPLFIRIAAGHALDIANGNIDRFLEREGPVAVNGIRDLLDKAFGRLSDLEKMLIYWIAICQEPVSENELRRLVPVSIVQLMEVLLSLKRRCFIEVNNQKYSISECIGRYALRIIINQMVSEVVAEDEQLEFFNTYPLVQPFAKENIQ
ncbi:MAG: NB-ARC domain-containing protein [Cyanobacteria bacterium P01_F01_bin.53]